MGLPPQKAARGWEKEREQAHGDDAAASRGRAIPAKGETTNGGNIPGTYSVVIF
jgi:hypothetical protein